MIEFHAHREKLLQERLTVKSQDESSDNYRELHLHARVLGKCSTFHTNFAHDIVFVVLLIWIVNLLILIKVYNSPSIPLANWLDEIGLVYFPNLRVTGSK